MFVWDGRPSLPCVTPSMFRMTVPQLILHNKKKAAPSWGVDSFFGFPQAHVLPSFAELRTKELFEASELPLPPPPMRPPAMVAPWYGSPPKTTPSSSHRAPSPPHTLFRPLGRPPVPAREVA